MVRGFLIVSSLCLVIASHIQPAYAQVVVSTDREISALTSGYCFTDNNSDEVLDLGEINVSAGSPVMDRATLPASATPPASVMHLADNLGNITTIDDHVIDISGFCIGGVSRTDAVTTDYDDDDPADGGIDRSEDTTLTETSDADNYFDDDGFTFVGGSSSTEQNISFTGQVKGNIAAVASASNIVFSVNANSEIDGLLDLSNSIENAVLTLAGQIDEINLSGATNFNLTSTAEIGDTLTSDTDYSSASIGTLNLNGASDANVTLSSGDFTEIDLEGASNINLTNAAAGTLISASGVTAGLEFANTAAVTTIEFLGTDYLTADLGSNSVIQTLTANDITNPSSYIDNDGTIERFEIGNNSDSADVELTVINDGRIEANTSDAMVISDTDAGGGEIDVVIRNNGTIHAETSDAINFTTLNGGRIDILNAGTASTNSSGTNDVISASGARGLFYMENSGTLENNNNRVVNLQNFEGYFQLLNDGSIEGKQVGINLTGASASTSTAVRIYNGFEKLNGVISRATSGEREIIVSGSNAILLDNVRGHILIRNGAGASIIAQDSLAIAASGVTGNIDIENDGTIQANRTPPGASNIRAVNFTAITGDIDFLNDENGEIDARDLTVNLETVGGKITFVNEGDIETTQTVDDADATATDNYAVRIQRSGALNDENSITNSGTITSTTDHALLITDFACDADDDDNFCVDNSGTLSAGRQLALGGSAITDLKLRNSGTISALDQTVNLTDLSGDIIFSNSGTIAATGAFTDPFPDPDSTAYGMALRKASGADVTIDFVNSASGTISSDGGNTIILTGFNGANDDVDFVNSGTISASAAIAVDLSNSTVSRFRNNGIILVDEGTAVDLSNSTATQFRNDGLISTDESTSVDFSNATLSEIINEGFILAGNNSALSLTGVSGTALQLSNSGLIMTGASGTAAAPTSIYGTLGASFTSIDITNGVASIISTVGNALATASANSGGALFLDASVASVDIDNSGLIYVGAEATDSASAVFANHAIRITDIGASSASIINRASGIIQAEGDTAIFLKGDSADMIYFSLDNSGTIQARNNVIEVHDIAGASTVISNSGKILATASSANHLINLSEVSADFLLTNSGTISTAGERAIYVDMNNTSLSGDEMVVFNNQAGGMISASAATVTFLDVNEQINFDNAGTIRAASGVGAVSFSGIGDHQVDFDNNESGIISAASAAAVTLAGFEAALNFKNAQSASISASDNVIVLTPASTDARLDFSNSGTISASDESASHVLRVTGFGGELAFENLSGGTISSNGTHAVFADHQAADPSLDFDNGGTIQSRTGDAVVMSGFTGEVNINNSGTIEVTDGANALSSSAGNETVFRNSGRIEASQRRAVFFDNFIVDDDTSAPSFTNAAGGIIRAASSVFETDIGSATGQVYTLTNSGSIIADNGAYAVKMSGADIVLNNSGKISSTASPAILAGPQSEIAIMGSVISGGTTPVAIALEGRGSVVSLSNGGVMFGNISALDEEDDYTDAEKHQFKLSAAPNVSYYFAFPTAQFRFFIDDEEMEDGNGFAAATMNFQAMPLMHAHHAQASRNIWRQMERLDNDGAMKSFAFTDDLEHEKTSSRSFTLEGDRKGFVQSFHEVDFGWVEAQWLAAVNETSFKLDGSAFTFDKGYQALGLGFTDLLSFGPFSMSAMVMGGLGQTDMTRLVLTNTVSSGQFNLKSSYDTLFLDGVWEALLSQDIIGRRGTLTSRNPYRLNLELAFGGAVHTENNDGYKEGSYITVSDKEMQSSSLGGRVKLELASRNPYSYQDLRTFIEFEQTVFDTVSGTDFSYKVDGAAKSIDVESDQIMFSSLAIGMDADLENGLELSLSYTAIDGDNESTETSLNAGLKWYF